MPGPDFKPTAAYQWLEVLLEASGRDAERHRPRPTILSRTMAVVLTSNVRLIDAPGNVLLPAKSTGLPKDSVVNVSRIITLDRDSLDERSGRIHGSLLKDVENGLRLVLDL